MSLSRIDDDKLLKMYHLQITLITTLNENDPFRFVATNLTNINRSGFQNNNSIRTNSRNMDILRLFQKPKNNYNDGNIYNFQPLSKFKKKIDF